MKPKCRICDDSCPYFDYIGEGDAICDQEPTKFVMEDWTPAKDFLWCQTGEQKEVE